MGPRTLQPGHSVTASFAGSFLLGVLPSQCSPHISFRRFAISGWTYLDAIAEAMHTKAGTTIPSKTTQARAFHSPFITLLTDQMQAHSPAVAEGSAIRALKATSDDLARAREKLQAHGLELTPKKDGGRPSAPSAPADPPVPHQPPALPDVLQPSYPTLKDDAPEAWTAPSIQQWMQTFEPKTQEAAQEILRLLQTSKVSTDQLTRPATGSRWFGSTSSRSRASNTSSVWGLLSHAD